MGDWQKTKIGQFLFEREGTYEPDNTRLFQLDKIQKIDFSRGKIHLGKYSPTKTKQIIVEPDDFVFSGLNIEKGAVSINKTGKRLVVSTNYSTCEVDYTVIDKEYLSLFISSQKFKSLLIDNLRNGYGFTRPKHILPLEIDLPDIEEQEKIVSHFKNIETEERELKGELSHQETLLKKLRQQILQEAIEGKLTIEWREQNPDVEPASELLARIQAEKEQLIKRKKIKKQKPLPPISQKEKPFELPEGWEWCRLSKLTFGFQYGTSSKSSEFGSVPVLRMGNIKNGKISWDRLVYSNNDKEIEKFSMSQGDLLFNRTNSRELVGKTGLYRGERIAIYAGYLVRFHMAGDISPEFSNLVMNSPLHNEWCNVVKTDALGQSNINATKLGYFKFPLPPLPEQKVITTKVQKLLTLCDKLEDKITTNQTHAEQLMQAVLKETFQQNSNKPDSALHRRLQ